MVFLFAKPNPLIYVFNHNPPSSWISRTFVQLHFSQSFLKKCKQLHFSKEFEKVFHISNSSCIVCSTFTYKHAQFFFLFKNKNLHSFKFGWYSPFHFLSKILDYFILNSTSLPHTLFFTQWSDLPFLWLPYYTPSSL